MSRAAQSQQAPFPNKYTSRKVAASDSKPCSICYKPTTTVLISDNQADFFYVCDLHLQDDQFATAIKEQNYTDLQSEVEKLKNEVEKLRKDVDAEKPYLWGLNNYWKKSGSSSTSGGGDDNKVEKLPAKHDNKYQSLKNKLGEQLNSLQAKEQEVESFKFKNFALQQTIYRNRLMLHQKKKYNVERSRQIQESGFFPTAPSHNIS
ncbi:uncharacterized protein LODBEIA_P18380 [Lodderomyces beijingensis]|uniref:VPS4-associated protein 1 n=1 Tax=Lodderomyces beijingensis TaxID=1775926 RepID=A0ABP0ZHH3_9ASCO